MIRDPDADLLASLSEPERFEGVVTAYFSDIFRYLARRIGSAAAEDVAAETFEIGFRLRDRFDPVKGSARAWLFGIATNLNSNHQRSERRRLAAYARSGRFELEAVDSEIASHIDADRQLRRVAAALERLDAAQRDALHLVALVGLSDQDAADALAIPVGTLKSRVSRGRARLRADLAQTPFVEPNRKYTRKEVRDV